MTLAAKILHPATLSASDREAMFVLMDRHYENMVRSRFDADLAEKDWVILLLDDTDGSVCGFSTQVMISVTVEGRAVRCVFSGDTIVDPQYWGSSALALAFGKLALHWMNTYPDEDVYWCLISKGFRTYRVLSVYFRDYHPRHDATMPEHLRKVIAAVAQTRFPERFDAAAGIVRASVNSDRLRCGLGEVTVDRLRDPNVRFFVECNPGHAQGDELCCIARMSHDNFSAAALRMIRSTAFLQQRIG